MLQRRLDSQKQRRQRRQLLEGSSSSGGGNSRSSRCRANYLPGLLIVLLVLLQNFELHMCRQLMGAAVNRRKDMDTDEQLLPAVAASSLEKRAIAATTVSQPEEIFSAPNDAADMSYDEYPMVVPKRAALLLDRLMVALHHALENEREDHRIGDFYANKNMMQMKPNEYKNALEPLQATQEGAQMPMSSHSFHMYSDDDPGVMLDYDFKDINQINRATGETLMAKSFQRRAGGIGAAASASASAASSAAGNAAAHATNGGKASAGSGPASGARRIHHHVANGGGRMYWRCYFNASLAFGVRMLATRQIQRRLYELFAYYAIFIGVTSYRYDFELRQCRSTRWTRLVASLANLIIVSVSLVDLFATWFVIDDMDLVTEQTVRLDSTVNDIVCLVRVLQRLPQDRACIQIVLQLRRLRRIHQYAYTGRESQLEQRLEQRLDRIYLAKNCVMWAEAIFLLAFMLIVCQLVPPTNLYVKRLLVILNVLAMDGQGVVMHMHFLINWRILRLYMRLNRRLRQLLHSDFPAVATLELHHLRWQHAQLSALMERLTSAYSLTMLSNRLCLIVTAAALGYYISIFGAHPILYQIVGFGFVVVLALDGYILDLISDWTVNCHRESSRLLAQHQQLVNADRQLSRACDIFALQVACFPLKIQPFGLVECGKATWLGNMACIIGWLVVLLQYRIVFDSKH
ncbi:uncharacterized protein AstCC [Drosophila montana]|uniref:uncharacterized protein AstCC n=1 Tax=Drosophila montana TaxID=40370 RepID=UPI00313E7876